MPLGTIRRSKKRAAKVYYKIRDNGHKDAKKVQVEVFVGRYDPYLGGGYSARACLKSMKKLKKSAPWHTSGGVARCGRLERGTTPTKAMKKALRSLSTGLK